MKIALLLVCTVLFSGCAIRFANADRRLDSSFRKIYVPSATDMSTTGGNSGKLSMELRKLLALDTRFELVGIEKARWALDIEVLDRKKTVVKIGECLEGRESQIAGQAFNCKEVLGTFNQATAGSEEEAVHLSVRARAVDLNSGKTMFTKNYAASSTYRVVGSAETEVAIQRTPQLHSLRYQENLDNAVSGSASSIASQIAADILSL